MDGHRDILGIWAGDGAEGGKYWISVLTELKNRGVVDVCIVVCDGVKGLPEAITTVWPQALVQTCILHLIQNTFRCASRKYWEKMAKDLRPVYTAPGAAAAAERFAEFSQTWGEHYPAIVQIWRSAWAGSPGALPRRSPLRTGRARFPGIRLKQAQEHRGRAEVLGCRAGHVAGRSQRARGATRQDRSTHRVRCVR
ncbi:Transposase, Mutator family [Haloechinothrix alba]|uniref:Mutator family transposase n=1 Tax=Haloechinothrix alba TaxID=664784 RepID=A0A239ALT3_9PSEU|nr:Transposase, Mutator family [Haloechinothrix alba]